jgi:hypothetical protein
MARPLRIRGRDISLSIDHGRAHRWEKGSAMTWDMVLVTVTLFTVLLSIVLLVLISRIWQGETSRKLNRDPQHARLRASRSDEIQKVSGQQGSLA